MCNSNSSWIVKNEENNSLSVYTGLFIDNEFVPAAGDATIDLENPATGEHLATVSCAQEQDVDKAVKSSQAAHTSWKTTAPGIRRQLLNKLADLLERDAADVSALESLDAGILFNDSTRLNVPQALENLRYFAGWADKVDGLTLAIPEGMAYTRREPYGVCAAIVPWNSPL